jgi:outer membrane protein
MLRQALATDPAVAGAQAQLRATAERVTQARSGYGPSANATGNSTDTRYDEPPGEVLRPFRSMLLSLQITQPLIRPTLFPALEGARAQLAQAEAALAQAQAESAQRLIEVMFELLKSRDALAFARAQQMSSSEQLALARRSFTVGTAAITDVREAEAKADNIAAQVMASEADVLLRQQVLLELAGPAAPDMLARGLDGQRLPVLAATEVLEWLSEATASSPQLVQARQALASAEAEVRKSWLAHAPTADLTYTWSRSQDTGTVTSSFPRRGDSSAIGVNITIPLFASGATQSKVRETIALRDKAQADVDTARRTVTLGVRQAFSTALGAIAQARGLNAAVQSQELALRANRRGYEVGMKINAEVLDAQTKLFEARRDLSKARYDAWSNYYKLKALTGQLGDADFAQLDGLLGPLPAAPDLPAPPAAAARKATP